MNTLSSLLYFIGEKIGSVHISTTEPTSADGNDGDIWFVYEATEDEGED